MLCTEAIRRRVDGERIVGSEQRGGRLGREGKRGGDEMGLSEGRRVARKEGKLVNGTKGERQDR